MAAVDPFRDDWHRLVGRYRHLCAVGASLRGARRVRHASWGTGAGVLTDAAMCITDWTFAAARPVAAVPYTQSSAVEPADATGSSRQTQWDSEGGQSVESRCGAVAVDRAPPLPPLSVGGAQVARPFAPFLHPAHRTGRALLTHPALGQDITPSPTPRRAPARSVARARSARRGVKVDRSHDPATRSNAWCRSAKNWSF